VEKRGARAYWTMSTKFKGKGKVGTRAGEVWRYEQHSIGKGSWLQMRYKQQTEGNRGEHQILLRELTNQGKELVNSKHTTFKKRLNKLAAHAGKM